MILDLIVFILVLSALIVVHEFGHFLVAKKNGVVVEKFSIGFGPVLFSRKGKETEFLISAFPLGGYVKLKGESRTECSGVNGEFFSKPVGIRSRVVLAGPFFNYIFAFVLFWIIAVIGFSEPDYNSTAIGEVLTDYPAAAAGLKADDQIVAVNGVSVGDWKKMQVLITDKPGNVAIKVKRNDELLDFTIERKASEIEDYYGRKSTKQLIGITPSVKQSKYNVFTGFLKGLELLFTLTWFMIKGFWLMLSGALPAREALSGPIGIYHITAQAREAGIGAIFHLMAVLNISLTIINLLPLPLMDGGHAFFFFLEKIRGKQLSEKTEDIAARVGFGLIILLMVFTVYNDLLRFGPKWMKGKDVPVESGSIK